MQVKIEKVLKGQDGTVFVSVSYPGAMGMPTFLFKTLPQELGVEVFEQTSKDKMDKMRGAPNA